MANRFWVGGTGNWNATAGTKWSAVSGGAGGEAVPTASDDVFFDAASGAVTVTVYSYVPAIKTITFTGFIGTFSGYNNTGPSIRAGGLTLVAGMSLGQGAQGATFSFQATGGSYNINTAGKTLGNSVTFAGTGATYTLQSDLTTIYNLNVASSTFDANGYNVTCLYFNANYASARTLTMGSGTWTLTGTGTIFNIANTGTLTFSATNAPIIISNTSATARTFIGGGKSFGNLTYNAAGTGQLTITGSNTFPTLTLGGSAKTIKLTSTTTTTITTLVFNGTVGNVITLQSSTAGSAATISQSSGTVLADYVSIKDSTVSGGASFFAGKNSTNVSGNTGWNFISTNLTNPTNAYSSNDSYATCISDSGDVSISLSKDGGTNYHNTITKTFTGVEGSQTYGSSTELWGTSWGGDDIDDTSFRLKVACGTIAAGSSQIYKDFGFAISSTYILTGIEISVEAKWDGTTTSIDHIKVKIYYGQTVFPVSAGSVAYASDGRKAGEGAGSGTGVLIFNDGTSWIASDSGTTVAA